MSAEKSSVQRQKKADQLIVIFENDFSLGIHGSNIPNIVNVLYLAMMDMYKTLTRRGRDLTPDDRHFKSRDADV